MKPTSILLTSILVASAFASAPQPMADLVARALDPATMDPTKLSVLSVLKTAMPTPTGTDTGIVLPTGDVTPQWYKDLPADVIVLLAQIYPATLTAAASVVSETAVVSSITSSSVSQETSIASASQTTLTRTLELVPSATATGNGTLSANNNNAANSTPSTGKPSPSQSAISTGAKNAIGAGSWSVAMGFTVAAVFCFFA